MSTVLPESAVQHLYNSIQQLPGGSIRYRLLFGTLRMLATLPPLRARIKHIGGRIYYIRGDHRAAERWLLEALAAGRAGSYSSHNYLGRSQMFLGRFDEAEANLLAAIAAAPWDDGCYLHMAETLRRQGKHEQEKTYLHGAIKLKPGAAWNQFCLFQNERGQMGAGAALDAWLDRTLAVPQMEDPIIHPNWWMVSQDIYTEQRVEKARALLAQHQRSHDCHLLLAYLLRFSDNPAAGVPYLQAAARRRWEDAHGPGSAAPFSEAKPPAFLVIGLAKGGSTSLYNYLCSHPLIWPAVNKEINFWNNHYDAGRDWYLACFPPIPAGSPDISGEASINSFWSPKAAQRIARDAPDMKLILILREPAARAFSDYNMMVRLGREERSWEECMEQQMSEFASCPVDYVDKLDKVLGERNYLLKGATLPVLKRWLQHHNKDKLLVLDNRDLGERATTTMNRVFRFLGLPEHDIVAPPRINVGGYKRLDDELNQQLQQWYQPHQEALQEFLVTELS